ncbi:MAG: NADH-ubiquinone oxidoreductase-F iron-sulfur binding region domain-containing protein [Actinomycetota bacterium]
MIVPVGARTGSILLRDEPLRTLDASIARGGGKALSWALASSPDEVIDVITASGLRGRGGAGFPTGVKWRAIRDDPCTTTFVVCNGADGEPGTFKDRWLLRLDPYQVLEGLAIAAHAVGATKAFVAVKARFEEELAIVRRAIAEMQGADMLGPVPVEVILGPDEYLFGEERALLEVIEGNDPLPRILPAYQVGLFATRGSTNPTATNNVETLANVPQILREGAAWFRSFGTGSSPGTMVFTVCGDVRRPGVYELPLGTPLRVLIEDVGGGPLPGRRVKAVVPGASGSILPANQLDVPMDFDSLKAAGSGLGSGGFVVYDDSACMVAVTLSFSRFLAIESCAQCPACKHGAEQINGCLARIEAGEGSEDDLSTVLARSVSVTSGQRCALPTGEALLVQSALRSFGTEFREHLGRACPRPRPLPFPKIVDLDQGAHRFLYDDRYLLKRPDWTYEEPELVRSAAGEPPA